MKVTVGNARVKIIINYNNKHCRAITQPLQHGMLIYLHVYICQHVQIYRCIYIYTGNTGQGKLSRKMETLPVTVKCKTPH